MARKLQVNKVSKRRAKTKVRTKKKDPIFVDGQRPRPMYVDYKDVELLRKLTNRQGKIISRRKSGCTAVSQHAVTGRSSEPASWPCCPTPESNHGRPGLSQVSTSSAPRPIVRRSGRQCGGHAADESRSMSWFEVTEQRGSMADGKIATVPGDDPNRLPR